MAYGWLIKHQASGAYCIVSDDGATVTVTPDPEQATLFPSRADAVRVIVDHEEKSATFPDCDVVDYTQRQHPIPDADMETVRTRAEVLADAHAAGADRRAAHAAARAAARAQPSGRLIPKTVPQTKGN